MPKSPIHPAPAATTADPSPGIGRRQLFGQASLVAAGIGLGVGGTILAQPAAQAQTVDPLVDFHGPHQAGIDTPIQAHTTFCSFTLRPEVTSQDAQRLLRLITDDAARLTQGQPALNDQEQYLATATARLTITVGFGPSWFTQLGLADRRPDGFADLPKYRIDRLQPRFNGGDLLLQVGGDEPLLVAHAVRQLTKTTRSFAKPRWTQQGFSQTGPATPRNLMGQVDGTVNPTAGSDFDTVVWSTQSGWFAGGTMLVLRRISMTLDTWDELDDPGKEQSVGRRLDTGAPLTGVDEFDAPDFTAVDAAGIPRIAPFSHVARAHPRACVDRMLRRSFNYVTEPDAHGEVDQGLLFAAYCANLTTQYLPVQQRLADQDLLNDWTVPIGSAVFALPPGCAPGEILGAGMFR